MKDAILKPFRWLKHKIKHKLEHYSLAHFKELLRRHGLALLIIFIVWEIIEDILFPALFIWLGNNVKSHLMAQSIKINHFKIYLTSLAAVFLFIGIKFYNSKFKIKYFNIEKINNLFILILLFFFKIPPYYLGSYWGR